MPKLCATKAHTLVNHLRWLLFLPKTAQFAHSNIDGVVNAIGGQGSAGCLLHAGKGRHWPPQKNPAAPGHDSLDGRIRGREGGSDPSVVGALMGARKLFPRKPKQHT